MLVTKPIKFSLVLIKILCVMGSCQKQDNAPPRINVNTPLNNSSFQIPCMVQVEGDVNDNKSLSRIEISVVDENSLPVTTTISQNISGDQFEFNEQFIINNRLLPSGNYFVKVRVEDEAENSNSSYTPIALSEVTRELLGIYLVSSDQSTTNLSFLDDMGNITLKSTILGNHKVSEVNSKHQYIFLGTDVSGISLETDFYTTKWEVPFLSSTYDFFQDVNKSKDNDQLYISNGDGVIRRFDKNGIQIGGYVADFQNWFAHLNEVENYVIVDTYSNLFTRWITVFNKSSGIEHTRKSITGEVVEIGQVNNSLCFMLIQNGNDFYLAHYDLNTNNLWTEASVQNNHCYNAQKKGNYLYITTDDGLYRFNYNTYQLLPLIVNFPCSQINLEDISGDLIISDAQNVYLFNEQLGIYNTFITSDSVENILVYYNK